MRGVIANRYKPEPISSDDISAYDDIALSLIPMRVKSIAVSPLPPPDKARIFERADNDAFAVVAVVVLEGTMATAAG